MWPDQLEIARLLVEASAEPNARDDGGNTALERSAMLRRERHERSLIEAGANVNSQT